MKDKLSQDSKLFISSMFFTNIGNGLYILAISKALYEHTNSILGFSLIILSEFLFKIILQSYAGFIVDRMSPLKICKYSEFIRGILFILATIAAKEGRLIIAVGMTTIAVNFFKPFYISSSFRLGKILNHEDQLGFYNSIFVAFKQGGFLLGIFLGGVLLTKTTFEYIFLIDGLTYFFSFGILFLLKIRFDYSHKKDHLKLNSIKYDWKGVFLEIKHNSKLKIAFLKSLVDPIGFYFLNVMIVPISSILYKGNTEKMALLQLSFVLGAVMASLAIKYASRVKKEKIITYFQYPVLIQSILIAIIPFVINFYCSLAILFSTSFINIFTYSLHYSEFQKLTPEIISGKVSSLYIITLSFILTFFLGTLNLVEEIDFILCFIFASTCIMIFSMTLLSLPSFRKKINPELEKNTIIVQD